MCSECRFKLLFKNHLPGQSSKEALKRRALFAIRSTTSYKTVLGKGSHEERWGTGPSRALIVSRFQALNTRHLSPKRLRPAGSQPRSPWMKPGAIRSSSSS
jgi:hypothetical protein